MNEEYAKVRRELLEGGYQQIGSNGVFRSGNVKLVVDTWLSNRDVVLVLRHRDDAGEEEFEIYMPVSIESWRHIRLAENATNKLCGSQE